MNGPGLLEMTLGLRKTYDSKLSFILSGTALIDNCYDTSTSLKLALLM